MPPADALEIFHPNPKHDALLAFSSSEWDAALAWLYHQGMSLYFASRLRELGLNFLPPPSHRAALHLQREANNTRTAAHFDEFVRLNHSLTGAKLTYANVLGFALAPFACPDPHLRFRASTDIMLLASHRDACSSLLHAAGYALETDRPHLRIFRRAKHAPGLVSSRHADETIRTFLIPDDPSSDSQAPHNMLLRRREQSWNGFPFPAPLVSEHIIALALAIYGDTFEGTVTLSAIYEFNHAAQHVAHDTALQEEIERLADEHAIRPQALGFAGALCEEIFHTALPPTIRECTHLALSEDMARCLTLLGLGPDGRRPLSEL